MLRPQGASKHPRLIVHGEKFKSAQCKGVMVSSQSRISPRQTSRRCEPQGRPTWKLSATSEHAFDVLDVVHFLGFKMEIRGACLDVRSGRNQQPKTEKSLGNVQTLSSRIWTPVLGLQPRTGLALLCDCWHWTYHT